MELSSRASGGSDYRLGPDARLLVGCNPVVIGACLLSLAFLSNLEVLCLIPIRFRRRGGLYFWTVVVAAVSSTFFTTGITLLVLVPGRSALHGWVALTPLGDVLYEPAEFLLVYSRLHLISASRRLQRCVLLWIAAHTMLFTIPSMGITIAGTLSGDAKLLTAELIILRVKNCAYTVTEILLSAIFLYQVAKAWNRKIEPQIRPVLRHIMYGNILMIGMHSASVTFEFLELERVQACWAVRYLLSTNGHVIPLMLNLHRHCFLLIS
jgi:hypothetical protein